MKFGKMTGFLVKAVLICALSGGLAVAFNTARPKPYTLAELSHAQPAEVLEITTADLVESYNEGKFFFIDARGEMEFAMGHVPGAVNLPSEKEGEEFTALLAQIDPNIAIVVYCDGLTCGKSLIVAKKLLENGFRNVSVYNEGIDGWISAGMDLEAN
ncbi:rhodanese-like domain-containing protein [Desulfovibrio sp. JC010]|uniref:rhodanese-like domain-containing protein n=1 Tax=Desulfovibrio sp. JC010 TaxID=2593641 RepID=UPI0013D8592B|nr:rhodanese-like domain-containing protein [Desulfovibrio sp. JC010]NDV27648.1 rhodanese-like domain-containing protein [Desulfovibrio sp. JC010]